MVSVLWVQACGASMESRAREAALSYFRPGAGAIDTASQWVIRSTTSAAETTKEPTWRPCEVSSVDVHASMCSDKRSHVTSSARQTNIVVVAIFAFIGAPR